MPESLSANTQAILLLTAPLMLGKGKVSRAAKLLTPSEYQRLALLLVELERKPADLLSPSRDDLIEACREIVDSERLATLLNRGFLLSQALERWQARSIWVVSRADAAYPRVVKSRLKAKAPAVLYGCGNIDLLRRTGLAVVGSRKISDELVEYASGVGALAARARCSVVSGGARGVDRSAMDGALGVGGEVVGVLAEELEREAMHRRNRHPLKEGRLVLVSEYDPLSRFTVGHAMQRNKLIYAFAEHALVVNSDLGRGGTWAGAVEQLDRLQFSTVFVRSTGPRSEALEELLRRGARSWPNPTDPERLFAQLASAADEDPVGDASTESIESSVDPPAKDNAPTGHFEKPGSTDAHEVGERTSEGKPVPPGDPSAMDSSADEGVAKATEPAEALFKVVGELVLSLLQEPHTEAEVAKALDVNKKQARDWLHRLVEQGQIERKGRPIRYRRSQPDLWS